MLFHTLTSHSTDPDIFCLAHLLLVDLGQDLYYQLRRIPYLIRSHRSRPRHRYLEPPYPNHSEFAHE